MGHDNMVNLFLLLANILLIYTIETKEEKR
nr:MAG TPA: hypothetical protein [Caudoviricetes sp.]